MRGSCARLSRSNARHASSFTSGTPRAILKSYELDASARASARRIRALRILARVRRHVRRAGAEDAARDPYLRQVALGPLQHTRALRRDAELSARRSAQP